MEEPTAEPTDRSDDDLIYKILSTTEWDAFQQLCRFTGSAADRKDGFIHFSTGKQLADTARKHFGDLERIWVIGVDQKVLGAELRFEPSRGGDLFPHLYRDLLLSEVSSSRLVERDSSGEFCF